MQPECKEIFVSSSIVPVSERTNLRRDMQYKKLGSEELLYDWRPALCSIRESTMQTEDILTDWPSTKFVH